MQSPVECVKVAARQPPLLDSKIVCSAGIAATVQQIHFPRGSVLSCERGANPLLLSAHESKNSGDSGPLKGSIDFEIS
ncbi:MAG: hypothetical protein DMG16_12295 [Acidobacteria bacterium]|nr:MAG: hypothetical protein DMG16_12295 [Acidobacteriota bacterium]